MTGATLPAAAPSRHRPVQSVARATALLSALGALGRPANLSELAATCHLQRATAWRLLVTLEDAGFVERDGPTSGFRVGAAAVAVAAGAAGDVDRLVRSARPGLERLVRETALTAGLCVVRGDRVDVVDQVDAPSVVAVNWVGREFPLHTSSPGKLLLAFLPPEDLDRVLSRPLERLTPRTITRPGHLREELEAVRRSNTALSDEEFEEGCVGISSGVEHPAGGLMGMISLTGPSFRMPPKRRRGLASLVREAAEETSRSLAGSSL